MKSHTVFDKQWSWYSLNLHLLLQIHFPWFNLLQNKEMIEDTKQVTEKNKIIIMKNTNNNNKTKSIFWVFIIVSKIREHLEWPLLLTSSVFYLCLCYCLQHCKLKRLIIKRGMLCPLRCTVLKTTDDRQKVGT